MDLTPFVDNVRRELAIAAEAGGDDARALAERLTAPLASSIRLTLLDALSAAADEITRELAPGSVEVRLRAGDAAFAVTPHTVETPAAGPEPAAPAPEPEDVALPDDDSAMVRINLRLTEQLKARVEAAAAAEGRSVNAWLVRAATAALAQPEQALPKGGRRISQRYTGWVS
ncbi:toxin-antitoxin system HicB family antitoxin [Actinophytocola glycyrrhizae]|uniref:Toxin-antitoxin system HicB family antitoxin n=1 Tax=Actinophytocola glycyrrhizae TaxID=2044873 RepID=A0ABV9RU28_9PSEU